MKDVRFPRLDLLTLGSFAVAQPLYDLIGRNTPFLVAHDAGRWTIAALVLALSLGVPLALVAIVDAVRLVHRGAGAVAQRVAAGLLGALIVAGFARALPAAPAIALAAAAGAALAAAYGTACVRRFLLVLSPAIVLFPLIFVALTPVSRLVWPHTTVQMHAQLDRQPPIVLVIFDEFSTFDLLDGNGGIARGRFPSFASLAATSSWFPNAVSPFPYTERAIPAILTGTAADGADARLPIEADYPQNLFIWLGGAYTLHASEPVIALCPEQRCETDASDARAGAMDLVSDVAILYLHLVMPHDVAERRLPSLTGTWQRFATAGAARQPAKTRPRSFDVVSAFDLASQSGRDTLFRRFIANIRPQAQPALHVIHALLPHDPYIFSPSGRRYLVGGLTEGMGKDGIWTRQQPLIDTGRERHLAQAQFADTLLGELLAHLRTTGLLDETLLIVTADHGQAFNPGESHRGLTESNAAEILPVLMFVKLPHQRTRAVSDRPVSGLDVLPTIAWALRTTLPWPHDGQSMLGDSYPARTSVEFRNAGVGPLPVLDVGSEARKGLYGAPALARTSPAPDLPGTVVHDLDAVPEAPGMRVFSESFANLENVTADGLLPVLVDGQIELEEERDGQLALALVLNGTIAAVARTVDWAGAPHYFSALLPERLVHAGSNRLDVLLVGGGPGARSLARVSADLARGITLRDTASGELLSTGSGAQMRPGAQVTGMIDRAAEEPDVLKLFGWAADRESAQPLRSIAAFSGGRAVAFATPQGERPDVTAALGLRPGQKVSYALTISKQALTGAVRVFGISAEAHAGRLQVSPAAAGIIEHALKTATRR